MGATTTRDQIVTAAAELMWTRGYAATSVEEIIQRADACKGSFYHHFASKELLGLAVIDAWAQGFADEILRRLHPQRRGLDAVDGALDAIVEIQRDNDYKGCLLGRMALEMADLSESFRERIQASFALVRSLLSEFLEQAGMTAAEADDQARYLFATLEGALLFTKVAGEGGVLERAVERMKADLRRQLAMPVV